MVRVRPEDERLCAVESERRRSVDAGGVERRRVGGLVRAHKAVVGERAAAGAEVGHGGDRLSVFIRQHRGIHPDLGGRDERIRIDSVDDGRREQRPVVEANRRSGTALQFRPVRKIGVLRQNERPRADVHRPRRVDRGGQLERARTDLGEAFVLASRRGAGRGRSGRDARIDLQRRPVLDIENRMATRRRQRGAAVGDLRRRGGWLHRHRPAEGDTFKRPGGT